MLPIRVSILCLSICIPALYAADEFRIVDGKRCVVKKRARSLTAAAEQISSASLDQTSLPHTQELASAEAFLQAARPTPFRDHFTQAPFTRKPKQATVTTTTTTTVAPVAFTDDDAADETDSDPSLPDTEAQQDLSQDNAQREPKHLTAVLTAHLNLASTTRADASTTTEDSKGEFMDMGDFDSDDTVSTNTVTQPPHVKRDFPGTVTNATTLAAATATSAPSTATTVTTQFTTLPTTLRQANKVKSQPLMQPWVAVREGENLRVQKPSTTTAAATTSVGPTAVTTTEAIDDGADLDNNFDSDASADLSEPSTTTVKSRANPKKVELTQQQRTRLAAAEGQHDVTTTTTTTTTTELVTNTTVASTSSTRTTRAITSAKAQFVAKRQEVVPQDRNSQDTGRSIRVVDADNSQNVQSPQILLAETNKALQAMAGSFKLSPTVDKDVNTTGMARVNGPDSPLLDGSYLSDPWMCRTKRDVIKSPIIMETCHGEKKQIVDLRVYKLVGIPTEECVTTPVVLGDRCTSLNGGRARCAQRYVRYGLIAQDLDSDRKGHECFRFPSACLCQLIVDADVTPLPVPDTVASST